MICEIGYLGLIEGQSRFSKSWGKSNSVRDRILGMITILVNPISDNFLAGLPAITTSFLEAFALPLSLQPMTTRFSKLVTPDRPPLEPPIHTSPKYIYQNSQKFSSWLCLHRMRRSIEMNVFVQQKPDRQSHFVTSRTTQLKLKKNHIISHMILTRVRNKREAHPKVFSTGPTNFSPNLLGNPLLDRNH